jgi:hypothetical protein
MRATCNYVRCTDSKSEADDLSCTNSSASTEGRRSFWTTRGQGAATEILHSVATRNQTENTLGIKEFGIGRSFCGPQWLDPQRLFNRSPERRPDLWQYS